MKMREEKRKPLLESKEMGLFLVWFKGPKAHAVSVALSLGATCLLS